MGRKRKNKRKPSPKGRGHVTRKTSRGNPISKGQSQVVRVPGSGYTPDAERVTLRFVDILHITAGSASGQLVTQNYGVNTPRVPDRTGSSGESQGFTALAAQYANYVCFGSRIKWLITQTKAGANPGSFGSVRAAVVPSSSQGLSGLSTIADYTVQKYARWHAFPDYIFDSAPQYAVLSAPSNRWSGRHSMTVSKLDGEPNLRHSSYEAATSADPARISDWVVAFADVNADSTFKPSMLIEVMIEYDCLFFNKKAQPNALLAPVARRSLVCVAEEKKSPPPQSVTPRALDLDEDVVLVKRSVFAAPVAAARATPIRSVSLK